MVGERLRVKWWLGPHLHDVHGHTEPLHFKFVKDGDRGTILLFKHWATDLWCEEGITLGKVRVSVTTNKHSYYEIR